MPHTSTKGRATAAAASLILLLAALGLAACGSSGGSSSTSAQTAANAAATGTPTTGATSSGTTPSGTTPSGTSSSGTSSTGTTPAGQPNEVRYNEVRECLSKKGITLPQRTHGAAGLLAGGANIKVPKGMSHAQLAEALRTCNVKYAGSHLPRSGSTPPGRPLPERFHHVLARFAACLRQNGVDVGEPNTSGKGPIFNTKGVNTGSPQFRAAAAKCRTTLFGTPPRKASSSSASASG
ncbi:MAG: hypothetical protein ACHQE6_07490 [Solirubrobacterales bacterium]